MDRRTGPATRLAPSPEPKNRSRNSASTPSTNRYDARPQGLADADAVLNAAVTAAHGWDADVSENEALGVLLEMNVTRNILDKGLTRQVDGLDGRAESAQRPRMDKQRASAPLGGALLLVAAIGRWQDLLAMVDLIDGLGLSDWVYTTIGVIGFSLIVYSRWPKSAAQKAAEQHQWSEESLLQDARERRAHHREMFPYYLYVLLIGTVFLLLVIFLVTCEYRPENPENTMKSLYRDCLRDHEGSPEVCNPILRLEKHQ